MGDELVHRCRPSCCLGWQWPAGRWSVTTTCDAASIVVLCTVLFLGGWAAIQSRRQKSLAHHVDRVIAGRRWYGILGLSSVVVAWMIVIWGISFPPSTPRGALLSLGASAASCLLGFVCAIVGISDPQSSGKRWCLAAVVACGTLVIFVVARMVFG